MRKLATLGVVLAFFACKSDKKNNSDGDYVIPSTEEGAELSPELAESINRGGIIYNNFCASCHMASGEGIKGTFPPLNKSDWLKEKREESIHAIKYGLRGPIEVNGVEYDNFMTDLGLEDQEVADVMNYISRAWDNNIQQYVTEEDVARVGK